MSINEDILKFTKFLDYYKEDYGKPSSEISKPKPDDKFNNDDLIPLVSSEYVMLDFDLMCEDATFYPKKTKEECNRPSTVDALYYRLIDDNSLEFYLVEFKSFDFNWNSELDYDASLKKVLNKVYQCEIDKITEIGINRLINIKDTYGSTIEFSLRLKPYESLFVVLPKIYEEYCQIKNIPDEEKLDLYVFFKSDLCIIKLFIVGKKNPDLSKAYLGKLGSLLEKQYKRLDYVNVFTPHNHRECFDWEFDYYTKLLMKCDNEKKSLNNTG